MKVETKTHSQLARVLDKQTQNQSWLCTQRPSQCPSTPYYFSPQALLTNSKLLVHPNHYCNKTSIYTVLGHHQANQKHKSWNTSTHCTQPESQIQSFNFNFQIIVVSGSTSTNKQPGTQSRTIQYVDTHRKNLEIDINGII